MQNERFKGMQTREMQLSGIRVLNEDDRTVELSFSSETPIERWGAFEVLSHTKSAVQLNRILTTGCLLYNHNRDTVIGKICSAKGGVVGDNGHLSNELSGRLLCDILHDNLKHIVLGHLSKENNYESLAYETVKLEVTLGDNAYKGEDLNMAVAKRDSISEIITV